METKTTLPSNDQLKAYEQNFKAQIEQFLFMWVNRDVIHPNE